MYGKDVYTSFANNTSNILSTKALLQDMIRKLPVSAKLTERNIVLVTTVSECLEFKIVFRTHVDTYVYTYLNE